ncbi:flagellar motor switch phosphatase FliY [Clostridium sp. BL-8]|uniref:flagellar motor switch phosphatase FliY n=1 Tax=Clostridium sp. BL-8 TaxID=349938 RepID=UPI0009C97036|nr:flagellar motor switch phosphatase FliY [Clostridium sp. BL-8]OOM79333.1 flagellar motor switch protein FliN [Clostridium sp. BL-8]
MGMSNNFLSQEEINALLAGEDMSASEAKPELDVNAITELDKDLLGEIGNISMGSASTALYQLINQQVNITTPVVSVTTLREIKEGFETPNIVLDIEYVSGIIGRNILIIKIADGLVISNLMMGGDGNVPEAHELSEIEISAVSEAMNQMIGSAATSMATMFGRKVDISPPTSKVITEASMPISDAIPEDQPIVRVSFKMTIGDIVDSNIMQIFPIETAKNIVAIMTGEENSEKAAKTETVEAVKEDNIINKGISEESINNKATIEAQPSYGYQSQYEAPMQRMEQPVEVHSAAFEPLVPQSNVPPIKNIDLILDVPLDISVVLGRTKKSIQDILNLGNGSLIELDKLAEEPVEILVNGKQIALGEVVVVDENFGIRITNIVSSVERIKRLK